VDGALVGADSLWPGPHPHPSFGCLVSLPVGSSSSYPVPAGPPVLKFESQGLELELEPRAGLQLEPDQELKSTPKTCF